MKWKRWYTAALVVVVGIMLVAFLGAHTPDRMVIRGDEIVSGKVILDAFKQIHRKEGYDIVVDGDAVIDANPYHAGQRLTWDANGGLMAQSWYQVSRSNVRLAAWRLVTFFKSPAIEMVSMNADGYFEVIVTNQPIKWR